MNKELIEILKCISGSPEYRTKRVICDFFPPVTCTGMACKNCPIQTSEYTLYKPYLIQL